MDPTDSHAAGKVCLVDQVDRAWPVAAWSDLHVVVAVSGGADSVALLRALQQLKRRRPGRGQIFAAHIHHQLRGAAASEDQRWVEQLCAAGGVTAICRKIDVAQAARREGDGLEAAARRLRYEALLDIAESRGARFVAVGHHRDDQVETFLFRLFRGAGLRGLAGMPQTRALSTTVSLVRPLLNLSRQQIDAYLDGLGQPYRTDATNTDRSFARNRIRHELLPRLRADFNADVDAAICRTSAQLADAQTVIDMLVEKLADACNVEPAPPSGISMDVKPLAACSAFLAAEVLRWVWRRGELPEQAMTAAHWSRLASLVLAGKGPSQNLPGSMVAAIDAGRLTVQRLGERKSEKG